MKLIYALHEGIIRNICINQCLIVVGGFVLLGILCIFGVFFEGLVCIICREPRGFAFVQFVDAYDAAEAQYHMNGRVFAGREISVVLASETRKRPEEMRRRTRVR